MSESGRSEVDAPVSITVVVPTRNRVELAAQTVSSCVHEAVPGVTVVVSDNSTDLAQAQQLQQIVADLSRSSSVPLHYVRPDQDLAMSEHWRWAGEQASALARGTHVMYVTDRTVLKRHALSTLKAAAATRPSLAVTYNCDVVDDSSVPVRLLREPWSGQVVVLPGERLSALASRLILVKPLPRLLNAVVPTAVLEQLSERPGGLFATVAPDFGFCFRYLGTGRSLVFVDEPLAVMHGLQRSNGATTARGILSKDAEDFQRLSVASGSLNAPVPDVMTNYNSIAAEYLAARQDGGAEHLPPLDWENYLRALALETDALAGGPLRDANERALRAHGLEFGRRQAHARSLARAAYYLRALGVRDFLVQSLLRVQSRSRETFAAPDAALARALEVPALERQSSEHLRFLRPSPAL